MTQLASGVEERLQFLEWALRASNAFAWEFDVKTGRVQRDAIPRTLGWSNDEIERTAGGWFQYIHPHDRFTVVRQFDDVCEGRLEMLQTEYRFRCKDGCWRWIMSRARAIEWADDGFPTRIAGTDADITEYKQAVEALHKTERRYRHIIDNTSVIAWEFDQETRAFTFVNDVVEEVLGYPIAAWYEPYFWYEHVHPDDRDATSEFTRERSSQGVDHELEYRMIAADDSVVWIRDYVSAELIREGKSLLHGVMIDITRQKQTEQALRRIVAGTTASGTAFLDSLVANLADTLDAKIAFVSELTENRRSRILAIFDRCGTLEPVEYDLKNTPCAEVVRSTLCYYPFDVARLFPEDTFLREINAEAYLGTALRNSQGEVLGLLVVINDRPLDELLRPEDVLSIFAARTAAELERFQVEHALREKERSLSTLLSNLPGMAYRCRNEPDWPIEFMSAGCVEITGFPAESFVSGAVSYGSDVIHPKDAKRVWDEVQLAVREQRAFQLTYRIVNRDGETRWVWEQGEGVYDQSGDVVAIEGFISDITERVTSEEQLREHQARLELLMSQSPAIMWTVDRDLRFTSASGAGLRDLGQSPVDIVGMSLQEYFGEEENEAIRNHRSALEGASCEYQFEWRGFVFQSRVEPLYDGQRGNIIGVIGIAYDMTARARYERELRERSERERLLFRELDHRVRNNLSSLAGLVDIARQSATNVQDFSGIMRGRINAMAMAHVLLSRGRGAPTDLEHLIDHIAPTSSRGEWIYAGESLEIPPAQTTSLAMIIHELLTNSTKHGALGIDGGCVRIHSSVQVDQDGCEHIEIRWRESGVKSLRRDPIDGVGMTLIRGLIKSDLRGRFSIAFNADGIEAVVTFPRLSDQLDFGAK